MAELKLVIGNKDGKSYNKLLENPESLVGRKLGDKIKGDLIGLTGYELEIKGGSNNSGSPMRRGIPNTTKIFAKGGPGVNPKKNKHKSDFIRKTVAGDNITERTTQINLKVISQGKKSLQELFGKTEAPKEETKPEEKPKEEVKQEAPKTEEKKQEVKEPKEEKKE